MRKNGIFPILKPLRLNLLRNGFKLWIINTNVFLISLSNKRFSIHDSRPMRKK